MAGEVPVTITVHSATGRLLRTFERSVRSSGEYEVLWDGRTDAGAAVPAGIYHVRLGLGSQTKGLKLIRQ